MGAEVVDRPAGRVGEFVNWDDQLFDLVSQLIRAGSGRVLIGQLLRPVGLVNWKRWEFSEPGQDGLRRVGRKGRRSPTYLGLADFASSSTSC